MNIIMRKANFDDLPKIQELNNKLFELEYKFFDKSLNVGWTYEKAGLDYFKEMIEKEFVVLAVIENEIVGYLAGSICSVSYTKAKLAELDNMFILEEYRKYGIGTMLVNEFKKYCLEKGLNAINVTASSKNKNAIAFYMKNGFEELEIILRCNL
jgi:ribosomal protein S18 acetylase RimI-like enzyme